MGYGVWHKGWDIDMPGYGIWEVEKGDRKETMPVLTLYVIIQYEYQLVLGDGILAFAIDRHT